MNTQPINPIRSEKGVALIIVLLLLAVMAGLTAGLTLNGQTEIAMASNERYYAGDRAAAESGLNRAIEKITADTTTDLLAAGTVPVIGNGPFALGGQYAYSLEILDDDDPSLYVTPLTTAQLAQMNEVNNNPALNTNQRLILRATGTGPNGTTVRIRACADGGDQRDQHDDHDDAVKPGHPGQRRRRRDRQSLLSALEATCTPTVCHRRRIRPNHRQPHGHRHRVADITWTV